MATSFSQVPIVDVGALKASHLNPDDTRALSQQLYNVFATTGFAYLINAPLNFTHGELFDLSQDLFSLPASEKMKLAKQTFCPTNYNTYRGYFPTQPRFALDNLKEGFEIGNPRLQTPPPQQIDKSHARVDLGEPNVWPSANIFTKRTRLEEMYTELQSLSAKLLTLLAISLGKDAWFFDSWLVDSLSTLRLLHYPPSGSSSSSPPNSTESPTGPKLSCTPHTDSGILTLLHQDATGGLEVLNASDVWISAPYIPGSLVVNIGDLMAKLSGGRLLATMHRVKASSERGRYSVPFFFEPGEGCVVRGVDDDGMGDGVVYGEHIRGKMRTWVEYMGGEGSEFDGGM